MEFENFDGQENLYMKTDVPEFFDFILTMILDKCLIPDNNFCFKMKINENDKNLFNYYVHNNENE